MSIADHLEQGMLLLLAIDSPTGVKYLVPAMLRVGLRKHHQFNVVGVPRHVDERLVQIIYFILGQR